MMKVYGYLYMGIYDFMKKTHYKEIPGIMACIWFTGLIGLNFVVLIGNMEVKILEHISSWTYAVILFVPIMILHYFIFLKGQKYKELEAKYANDTQRQKTLRGITTLLYAIDSFLALMLF